MDHPPAGDAAAPSWTTVLEAIAKAAVEATDAAAAWVVAPAGDGLAVVVSVTRPGDGAGATVGAAAGEATSPGGPAAYVLASAQPLALSPAGGRRGPAPGAGPGAGPPAGPPFGVSTSLLCVPCQHRDTVVGVLEVVDKAGGGTFSYEDLELATLLAGIAGAAMAAGGAAGAP